MIIHSEDFNAENIQTLAYSFEKCKEKLANSQHTIIHCKDLCQYYLIGQIQLLEMLLDVQLKQFKIKFEDIDANFQDCLFLIENLSSCTILAIENRYRDRNVFGDQDQ